MKNKIDTSGWKEFKLTDVFKMSNTKSIVQSKIIPDSGLTPYITSSSENNGILTYIDCPTEWIDNGNCIMIGGKTLAFTFQKNDFCSNDSHNIVLYLINKKYQKKTIYLFLISALQASLYQLFCWSDSISMKKALDATFFLPATAEGLPDFDYMDAYMSRIFEEEEAFVDRLDEEDFNVHKIDTSKWKEFKIGDLFDVVKGTRLTKADMKQGDYRFIGSSAINNGVTAYIDNEEHIHTGNKLTVCYNGSIGETFYHDLPFWASDDVNVLYPKTTMSKNVCMFIAPIIKCISKKYSYVNKWRQDVMQKEHIMLPVTDEGLPDFEYMDTYMQRIMEEEEKVADRITQE